VLSKPRLKSHLHAATVGSDKVFLTTEGAHYLVQGPGAVRVLPYLDGTHTVADIMLALDGELGVQEIMVALSKYERYGHVVEGDAPGDRGALAFWDAEGVDPAVAVTRLREAEVEVREVGDVPGRALAEALTANGVACVTDGTGLVVTHVADYGDPELARVNAERLADGRPWLLIKTTGRQLWLGPLLRPGVTGCWECLAQRLRGNRQVERYLTLHTANGHGRPFSGPHLASTVATAANLAATEVARIVAAGSPRLEGVLLTVDVDALETERHHLVRQPQCPACGDPAAYATARRVELVPRPKAFVGGGGHRTCTPQQTIARLGRHLSPILGAISSLKPMPMPDEDNGVAYSYSAGHNFAIINDSTYFLARNLRGRSGGKGRTDAEARVSAMCEAIERYCGVFRGDEPRRRARLGELGDPAVHPHSLLMFSEGQYAGRHAWNAEQRTGFHVVPDPFEPAREVDWTTAWSLTADEPRYVPTAYCLYGHPDVNEHFFCAADANGAAAGNTVEEATLQGLLELIERDAVALWWYPRARVPALDLDSLGETYVDDLRAFYAQHDRDLWVLDITTDLGVPCFAAVSRRTDRPVEDLLLGFGAHVDPHTAALRALTEMNQFLPAVIATDPDGSTRYWIDDPGTLEWWETATLASEPYLLPADGAEPSTRHGFRELASDDIAADVRGLVDLLAEHGHDVIAHDQTRPDIELSVVKVMAPGLRHFWRRLGPGRLYDVPPALGRTARPPTEDELNPKSIFF
jgi:oxazoline/thiazoline synthase